MATAKKKSEKASPAEKAIERWLLRNWWWWVPLASYELIAWNRPSGASILWPSLWTANGALLLLAVAALVAWFAARIKMFTDSGLPSPGVWLLAKTFFWSSWHSVKVRVQWQVVCARKSWHYGELRKPMPLAKKTTTRDGNVVAEIRCGKIGIDPSVVEGSQDYIKQVVGCTDVVVRRKKPGVLRIQFMFTDPMATHLPIQELGFAPAGMVEVGVHMNGEVAMFADNLSLLIGGLPGMGKSSLAWTYLASLIRKGMHVLVMAVDPKGGQELDALEREMNEPSYPGGTLKVTHYATNLAEANKLVEAAWDLMKVRQAELKKRRIKKHRNSKEFPTVVVMLDEILSLSKLCKQGMEGKLGQLLSEGRAAGFIVIGLAQVGYASELGMIRNLFPQRACFAMSTSTATETILIDGAEAKGATCSQLDIKKDMGICYMVDEQNQLSKTRVAFVSEAPYDKKKDPYDCDVARIAAGRLPEGMITRDQAARECTGYIVWSYPFADNSRVFLYCGETWDWDERLKQHVLDAEEPWWSTLDDPANEVDPAAIELQTFSSKAAAKEWEEKTIRGGIEVQLPSGHTMVTRPRYNVQHNTDNPDREYRKRPVRRGRRLQVVDSDVVEGDVLELVDQ